MTLFPDAVLVDTITFLRSDRAVIAATWCVYNDVILRDSRRACAIVAERGGFKTAGEGVLGPGLATIKVKAAYQVGPLWLRRRVCARSAPYTNLVARSHR